MSLTENSIREKFAALAHDQWWKWSKNLADNEPIISKPRLQRWEALWIPYSQLSEEMKEHDRKWADVYISVLFDTLITEFPGTEPEGAIVRIPDGTMGEREFNGTYTGQYIQKKLRELFAK